MVGHDLFCFWLIDVCREGEFFGCCLHELFYLLVGKGLGVFEFFAGSDFVLASLGNEDKTYFGDLKISLNFLNEVLAECIEGEAGVADGIESLDYLMRVVV